jgi:putative oxidoreductase
MKYIPNIVGVLLGLLFLMASATFLLNMIPDMPKPPEGSPPALFMGAFGPTGYMTFVKWFELIGGILVAIPKTRNYGLLVLGPIIINIIAFHAFVMKGEGLGSPMLIIVCLSALYLLWTDRKAFLGLMR